MKIENASIGSIGLIQEQENGEISQIGLSPDQSNALQLFLCALSKDSKLLKLPREYNLKLVSDGK